MTRPSQRREMVEKAVAKRGVSVALACRAFGVSETCYRYNPRLDEENEQIADLLLGLTKAKKTWGFGLCFLHLRNVQGHAWNHKRVDRIYREPELNLRIKPRRRLARSVRRSQRKHTKPKLMAATWSFRVQEGTFDG